MATPVNRYKQLLASVPKGSFYASSGQVIPHRSSPYDLRITNLAANRPHGIFINGDYRGNTTTDGDGVAIVSVLLYRGDNEVKLVDTFTQRYSSTYLTTRDYATLMAAQSDSLGLLDDNIEQILLDSRLETASVGLIEQVFGRPIQTANSFSYDLDTYRELLQELRVAYRHYGATVEGIRRVIRAFTKINPLIYDKDFGPAWILGKDIISPKNASTRFTYYTSSVLSNVNAGGAGVSIASYDGTVGIGTGTLSCYGTTSPKTLAWTAPGGLRGDTVDITHDGEYVLYGADFFDPVVGLRGPFDTTTITADGKVLRISLDCKVPIDIPLTIGAPVTCAQIVTDINNALVAHPAYGIAYNAAADAYDPFGSGDPFLRITPMGEGAEERVTIYVHPLFDASQILFNLPAIRGGLEGAHLAGVTSLVLKSSTDIGLWPDNVTADDPLKVTIGTGRFYPVGSAASNQRSGNIEEVTVTNVNRGTFTLTLASPTLYDHNNFELLYVTGESPYTRYLIKNSRGINVTVQDYTLLPSSDTTDSVVLAGTGSPDGWIITTNAGAAVSALPARIHSYFDTERDIPFDIPADGMITIPVPDEILAYKGYSANFIVWADIDDPGRAATHTTVNSIDISWDGGATYTSTAPTVAGTYISAQWRPREFSVENVIIPPSATKAIFRIKTNAAGVGLLTVHKVRVNVLEHGGLYLGSGTTPRSEIAVKTGSMIYVWSPERLSSYESKSVGLESIDQSLVGHIDKIAPDSSWLDKFDVSAYDMSGVPTNIFGHFDETGFVSGTAVNMSIVLRAPSRFTYMKPSILSAQEQTLQFSSFLAALTVQSDQDMSKSVLLEDGIPVPQDLWQYNSSTQVQILYSPSVSSVYTLQYSALMSYTTNVIDLGANFADYIWFADYDIYQRSDVDVIERSVSTGIIFDTFGLGILTDRSNGDKSTSTLIEDTGLVRRIIPSAKWSYVDNTTVQISNDIFNPGAIYELTYMGTFSQETLIPSITVQIRSATSSGAVSSATYADFTPNTVIDNTYRYHQIRALISDVADLRDIRLQSLLLKGLNAYGTGGTIPALRP